MTGAKGRHWKLSEETKQKQSFAQKKLHSEDNHSHKGKNNCMYGKKHSEETKKLISERLRGRVGNKSSNWQGGLTLKNKIIRNSEEYKLWRDAVFVRDKYTCVWCGKIGGKLNVDHIKPFALFPELRFAIDNGRTLCEDCHKTTDTYSYKIMKRDKQGKFSGVQK